MDTLVVDLVLYLVTEGGGVCIDTWTENRGI